MAAWLLLVLVSLAVVVCCVLGMSIGLIFRNKTFRACGNAARDWDGEPIQCAACGGQADAATCRRRRQVQG